MVILKGQCYTVQRKSLTGGYRANQGGLTKWLTASNWGFQYVLHIGAGLERGIGRGRNDVVLVPHSP